MKLWEKFISLGKVKSATSTELRTARGEFETERTRLAVEIEAANGRKAEVLRNGGPEALAPYQAKVRAMSDQLEAHDLAIADIDTKLAEAEKLEAEVNFEKDAKAAVAAMRTLDQEVRRNFLAKVDELAEIIKRGAELTSQVKAFNRTAGELGRGDRRILDESMAALNAMASRPVPIEHPLLSPSLARELEAVQQFAALAERQGQKAAA